MFMIPFVVHVIFPLFCVDIDMDAVAAVSSAFVGSFTGMLFMSANDVVDGMCMCCVCGMFLSAWLSAMADVWLMFPSSLMMFVCILIATLFSVSDFSRTCFVWSVRGVLYASICVGGCCTSFI